MVEEFELDKGLVFTGSKYCFQGRVEVLSLDESKEEGLHVYLTNENGYSWEENWNQAHVATGFGNGDYLVAPCETCDGDGKVRRNYTNEDGKYVFNKETCPDCNGDGISRMIDFGKTDEELEAEENKDLTIGGCVADAYAKTLEELGTLQNEVITLTNPYGNDVFAMNELDKPKPLTRGYYTEVTPKDPIGRNDQCPCGSGKKYKRCCINS